MEEFQLIGSFFKKQYQSEQILFGSGDDAACLRPLPNHILCVSTDTLVENVHFLSDWCPSIIATKAITVNVSDIAAMGATPKWVTVALTLPTVDESWLKQFSIGLFQTLERYDVALVGGDITRGPLTINVTIHGECPPESVTFRHGAQVDDGIYVTGQLGAPSLAVELLNNRSVDDITWQYLLSKLQQPVARTDCQAIIAKYANSCIDISDGLSGDLQHICRASHKSAVLMLDKIPVDAYVKQITLDKALSYALHGGDEYQLCFTVSKGRCSEVESEAKQQGIQLYRIGTMQTALDLPGIFDQYGNQIQSKSYQHF